MTTNKVMGLIGINTRFDRKAHVCGVFFRRFRGEFPVGDQSVSNTNIDLYLQVADHYFRSAVEVFKGYGDFFGKPYFSLQRDDLVASLTVSDELSVDNGFREFVTIGLSLMVRNLIIYMVLSYIILSIDIFTFSVLKATDLISIAALMLIKIVLFARYWATNSSTSTVMGKKTKGFFLELERDLSGIDTLTRQIGGGGVKVPEENLNLAEKLVRVALFDARRIEYAMRWVAVEVYQTRITLVQIFIAWSIVSLALTAIVLISTFGAAAANDNVNAMSMIPYVLAFASTIIMTGLGCFYLQMDFPDKLSPKDWVSFSEVAIGEKIAKIVSIDKSRTHQGSPSTIYEKVIEDFSSNSEPQRTPHLLEAFAKKGIDDQGNPPGTSRSGWRRAPALRWNS